MDNQLHHATDKHGAELGNPFWQHAHCPSHLGELHGSNGRAKGVGSCGDSLTVYLLVENDRIGSISHLPDGCLFTVACGSAMSTLAKGRTIDSALKLEPEDVKAELGDLPEDHMHCARLAVNTLGEAIADYYCQRCHRQPGLHNAEIGPAPATGSTSS